MRKLISILIVGLLLLSILAITSCEKKGDSPSNGGSGDISEVNQSNSDIKYRSASRTDSDAKGGLFSNSKDSNAADKVDLEYQTKK